MNRWNRLRWRIARRIAPQPIMYDPAPGAEAFVVARSKPGTGLAWSVAYPLDELSVTTEIAPLTFVNPNDPEDYAYRPAQRVTRITGSSNA